MNDLLAQQIDDDTSAVDTPQATVVQTRGPEAAELTPMDAEIAAAESCAETFRRSGQEAEERGHHVMAYLKHKEADWWFERAWMWRDMRDQKPSAGEQLP